MQESRIAIRHGLKSTMPVLAPNELANTTEDNIVFIGTSTGSNAQVTTRIKGSNESSFRSGDVTLTKDNIGLGYVENKLDSERVVKSAASADKLADSVQAGSTSIPTYFEKGLPVAVTSINKKLLSGTYDISISGNAATASSCSGNAATATAAGRLGTASGTAAGTSTKPVYFVDGLPKAIDSIDSSLLKGTYNIAVSGNATTATSATYVTTDKAIGSAINPVYVKYDTTNKRGIFTACSQAASGAYKSFVPSVDSDGVMEVGRYIDMHTPTSSADYDVRLTAASGSLSCSGTFTATKVYNAVWNDYADALPRDFMSNIDYGNIVALNHTTGKYRLATKQIADVVVGVCSDTYGHLLGGKPLTNMEDNLKDYAPIAVAGNVKVLVTGKVRVGDLITVSNIPGIGKRANRYFHKPGTIVGKALESHDGHKPSKILMQVMLA